MYYNFWVTSENDMVFITPEKRTKRMSSKVFQPVKEGKVREVYDNGDSLIIVATDRISAFDHILKNKVTKKGAILTQMSKFWFDLTKDIVPNHMIWNDIFCQIKPEFRHLSQNRTLFCDFILQNMIKSRNSVCRYNDQAVAVIIYFTYFSLFNWLKYFATHPLCPLFRCYEHHIIF